MVSECKIDIENVGAVSVSASEFVWWNGGVHDSITDIFASANKDNGNWTWLLVAARTVGSVCCTLHCT